MGNKVSKDDNLWHQTLSVSFEWSKPKVRLVIVEGFTFEFFRYCSTPKLFAPAQPVELLRNNVMLVVSAERWRKGLLLSSSQHLFELFLLS